MVYILLPLSKKGASTSKVSSFLLQLVHHQDLSHQASQAKKLTFVRMHEFQIILLRNCPSLTPIRLSYNDLTVKMPLLEDFPTTLSFLCGHGLVSFANLQFHFQFHLLLSKLILERIPHKNCVESLGVGDNQLFCSGSSLGKILKL